MFQFSMIIWLALLDAVTGKAAAKAADNDTANVGGANDPMMIGATDAEEEGSDAETDD